MEITGRINIFVNTHERSDGSTFNTFTTSIGGKKEGSDEYINLSLDVRFAESCYPAEKLNRLDEETYYVFDVEEGFLSVRSYEKDGEIIKRPVLVIKSAEFVEAHDLGAKPAKKPAKPAKSAKKPAKPVKASKKKLAEVDIDEDDLPF